MSIMQDPIMQSILQQAQGDPAALQEHMKNPGIRSKIQKLIASYVPSPESTLKANEITAESLGLADDRSKAKFSKRSEEM
jgi:stress-induced-phosphoprotein 1